MTPSQTRRPLAALAALLTVVATVAVGSTTAAYTDRAQATAAGLSTDTTRFLPMEGRAAATGVAVQDDGTIAIWGFRGTGRSGTGTDSVASDAPVSVITLPSDGHPEGRRRAIEARTVGGQRTASESGVIARSDDGRIYTWGGDQSKHKMGRTDDTVPFNEPGEVEIPGAVVDIAAGTRIMMALTSEGDLYTWGHPNGEGATGQGSLTASSPTPTRILDGVHSMGVGQVYGWAIRGNTIDGDPSSGVLWWGRSLPLLDPSGGDEGAKNIGTPTQSRALSAYTTSGCDTVGVVAGSPEDTCSLQSIAGNGRGFVARLADGSILTWGNPEGGLGRPAGTTVENATPSPVWLPDGVRIENVSVSLTYVLLHGNDGNAYVYGSYDIWGGPHPDTGMVSFENVPTPVKLKALGPVHALVGIGTSGAALRADGEIVLWGGGRDAPTTVAANEDSLVRDGFATTNTPTTSLVGLTDLVMPGTRAATP